MTFSQIGFPHNWASALVECWACVVVLMHSTNGEAPVTDILYPCLNTFEKNQYRVSQIFSDIILLFWVAAKWPTIDGI